MVIIWRWSTGVIDPVLVSQTREEVERILTERGYCVRPEWGKAIELTDKQWSQLKADIVAGRMPLKEKDVPTRV